jgi:hypothetical protein
VALGHGSDGPQGGTAKLIATVDHPFWVEQANAWVEAGKLEPGTWLRTSAGIWVQIKAVSPAGSRSDIRNLTIEGIHTYHVVAGAAPLLVHNSNCDPRIFVVDSAGETEVLPVFEYAAKDYPAQAASHKKAMDKGASAIGDKVSKAQTRKNRRAAQAGRPRPKQIARNAEWEEYPYASTAQGGAGASLTLSVGSQNSSHGSLLRWFYWRNKIGVGDRFFIRVKW